MYRAPRLSLSNIPLLLRPYQTRAVDQIVARLASFPILVSPTGSGKTVMLAAICRRLAVPVLSVAHRIELIDQAANHYARAGVRSFNSTSIQKIARRGVPDNVGLIIVDECHHVTTDGQYAALFNSGVPVVGATATPLRHDGRGLGNLFSSLTIAATPQQLVDSGDLLSPTIYSHSRPDLSGSNFTENDLFRRTNRPRLIADLVNTWRQRAEGLRTLAFAVNIAHSRAIVDAFRASGIAAEHLDGNTPADQREAILARLADGTTQIVSNVGIATEGFDLPALDCLIVARPTQSLGLWLQICGRVMRPVGQAIILDHAGNALIHGSPLLHIDWTLEDDDKQTGEPLGLKLCKSCYLMVPVHCRTCPDCGADLSPVATARQKLADGELVPFQDQAEIYNQLLTDDPDNADRRFRSMFGREPLTIDGRFVEPVHANKFFVLKHFVREARRKRQPVKRTASNRYKNFFGVWPVKYNEALAEILSERFAI